MLSVSLKILDWNQYFKRTANVLIFLKEKIIFNKNFKIRDKLSLFSSEYTYFHRHELS